MITAQKADKTRRFGVLQWNRLVKANQTDGWVEVKGGAQPPRSGTPGASPNKAFSPPEVANFPLKNRQEIEADIRTQVEAESKQKLDAMQEQIDQLMKAQGNQAGDQKQAPAATDVKTEAPAQDQTDAGKQTETPAAEKQGTTQAANQANKTGQQSNPNKSAANKAQGNQAGDQKGGK